MRSDDEPRRREADKPNTDRPPTRTVRRFVERGGRLLETGVVERDTRTRSDPSRRSPHTTSEEKPCP